jgi:Tetratricopeptide repeat/Protein of unknown function (DUF2914)
MLEAAETAANAGDLAAADDLLQRVARIQEAELGPHHPDLANTLNNRAIVAESTGQLEDAEKFYRRAVAIASASLPADDPMVASSRKNLEAFCRDRGLPIEAPPVTALSAEPTAAEPDVIAGEDEVGEAETTSDAPAVSVAAPAAPISSDAPVPVLPAPTVDSGRSSRVFAAAAIVLLAVASLFVVRSWLMRETPPQTETAQPQQPAEPAPPPSAAAPSTEQKGTLKSAAPRDHGNSNRVAATPSAPLASSSDISLVTPQLCRTFSTSDGNWRCEPVGNPAAPGPVVLYTRVRSAHDAVVIHRWYRGDALQKTARLTVRANATEGYRTYSRQTVRSGEEWRVEVTTANGDLLYEKRLAVATTAR